MKFNFALPYKLTFEDKVGLLGQDGRDLCDEFVVVGLADEGLDTRSPEGRDASVRLRAAFLDRRLPELRAKVTVDLILGKVVANKYGDKADRKIQRTWARVQDAADAGEELSTSDASWLVDLLFKPGRGDGDPEPTDAWQFPAAMGRWLNAFEDEALALCRAVRSKD